MYQKSNATIQGTIDVQMGIRAWCNSCHHVPGLDLIALRDRLGPDHRAMHDDLVPKLRCQSCDGKDIGLMVYDATPRGEDRARALERVGNKNWNSPENRVGTLAAPAV